MRKNNSRLWFCYGCLCALLACTDTAHERVYKETAYSMGSIVEFSIQGVDDAHAKAAVAAAIDDLSLMHAAFHPWQAGALGQMNALLPSGEQVAAAASLLPLITLGAELSEKSGGRFNPAIGKLVQLWGFNQDAPPQGPPPTPEQITAWLKRIPQMRDLRSDGAAIKSVNPDLLLDFGALAQGYAADRLIEGFKRRGIANAIVNISGDVRVIGSRNTRPWRIGIRNPRGAGILASVEMRGDASLVTSGDYERYYIYAGKRYHHILDPRTGYPTQGTASVTVIGTDAAIADAAATALMIAGVSTWHAVAKAMGITSVMLVADDGRVHMDPRTAQRIRFEVDPPPQVVISEPL